MKERPILFSAPMVRALLDGSKTQTRRVVKPQPIADRQFSGGYSIAPTKRTEGSTLSVWAPHVGMACPYGQLGDRLWVRETWNSSGLNWRKPIRDMRKVLGPVHYSADPEHGGWMPYWGTMKPSIHMPRWASRITLEITAVRVERLQDISELDALSEGVDQDTCAPVAIYRELWEQINGHASWDMNPWVWAIEFKRINQATA